MNRPWRLVPLLVLMGVVIALFWQSSNTPQAQQYDTSDYRGLMIRLVGSAYDLRIGAAPPDTALIEQIGDSGDLLYVPPLIDLLYFARDSNLNRVIFENLSQLTGQPETWGWREYFEWAGETNIELPPYYDEFKGLLFATFVDPEFVRFWQHGVQDNARVNLMEAVWGGVRVDGIPSLVNARQITPEEAIAEGEDLTQFCRQGDCSYPAEDELVFGVSINGDNRAYPLRLLNWHEMFNDVIGHSPLYDTPNGEVVCNFRAPTDFRAIAQAEGAWVLIDGVSAGCPQQGWLSVDALEWDGADWETLPDIADAEPLIVDDGIIGRVIGKPVMLAYCTLCGSGILYDVTIPDLTYTDVEGNLIEAGETVLEFGSTGMLMRSNKLMYDRNTDTVWNALTGIPAFGPLVSADIELDILPVVVTDWATWLEEHPDTSVLSLDTGFRRDYTNGGAYEDYFNSPDLMFPSWQQDTSVQENKDVVFALRLDNTPKAYPLSELIPEGVTNDTLSDTNLVIVSRATPDRDFFEPGGAAVRAYERGELTFSAGETDDTLLAEDGSIWTITEDALVNEDGDTLARLPGHLAFWFGWYSFYPDTLVYEA